MASSLYVPADQHASAHGVAERVTLYNGRKASLSLNVLIVGCGLGGLAAAHCLAHAGHKVTVFEAAHAIGEVGAGIQISPNITILLRRWGLGKALENICVCPEAIVFRRYDTGERVGYTRWAEQMEGYGGPYYHIHRADYHKLLFDLAAPNMTLRLQSTVVAVNPDAPTLTLASGEVVQGDLIIGADGIKSFIQQVVIGRVNPAQATGDAAYRAIIPTSVMLKDPELKPFVDTPEMTAWMGPGRHVMAYNIVCRFLYSSSVYLSVLYSAPKRSSTSSCFIQTMVQLSLGLLRPVRTKCALTSPISSLGTSSRRTNL